MASTLFDVKKTCGKMYSSSGWSNDVSLSYDLWVPSLAVESNQEFPLIIYLHGQGQSTKKNDGFRPLLAADASFRDEFVVLMPKCPKKRYWCHEVGRGASYGYNNEVSMDVIEALRDLIGEVVVTCPVDRSRITMVGVSMGGNGVLTYIEHCAEFITKATVVSGHLDGTVDGKFFGRLYDYGMDRHQLERISANVRQRRIPLWLLHSGNDTVCSYKDILTFWHFVGESGANIALQIDDSLTKMPFLGHGGPYDWLFSNGKAYFRAFATHRVKFEDSPVHSKDVVLETKDAVVCEDSTASRYGLEALQTGVPAVCSNGPISKTEAEPLKMEDTTLCCNNSSETDLAVSSATSGTADGSELEPLKMENPTRCKDSVLESASTSGRSKDLMSDTASISELEPPKTEDPTLCCNNSSETDPAVSSTTSRTADGSELEPLKTECPALCCNNSSESDRAVSATTSRTADGFELEPLKTEDPAVSSTNSGTVDGSELEPLKMEDPTVRHRDSTSESLPCRPRYPRQENTRRRLQMAKFHAETTSNQSRGYQGRAHTTYPSFY